MLLFERGTCRLDRELWWYGYLGGILLLGIRVSQRMGDKTETDDDPRVERSSA